MREGELVSYTESGMVGWDLLFVEKFAAGAQGLSDGQVLGVRSEQCGDGVVGIGFQIGIG